LPPSYAPPGPLALANLRPNHRTTTSLPISGDRAPPSRLTWPALSTASQRLLVASLHSR
jgi:hypothetical protein